jgi:hypothetical protein
MLCYESCCVVLRCVVLFFFALPRPVLSSLILSYRVLSCPVLSYSVSPYPALFRPFMLRSALRSAPFLTFLRPSLSPTPLQLRYVRF